MIDCLDIQNTVFSFELINQGHFLVLLAHLHRGGFTDSYLIVIRTKSEQLRESRTYENQFDHDERTREKDIGSQSLCRRSFCRQIDFANKYILV